MVTADDLAGTYTGVLEGVSVSNPADLRDPERQVIVDLDLLHQLTIRAAGTTTLVAAGVIPLLSLRRGAESLEHGCEVAS